ncbi:tyrosine--tRNA ligase [Candidatus Nomurabacteria bacterium]|nr:tyrosine--tRNA ligase [Candidatus Nomurabacteria bacterium]
MKLSKELEWRGFVNQYTYKDISALDGEPITFYFGVDPSASSMTVGNLAAMIMVSHFINHGHRAILLVGGATGMIGDPDGKASERKLLSLEDIEKNKNNICKQYSKILGENKFELVDNFDWFKDMSYLGFLRDIGKHVPMSQMLGRDFVKNRLESSGDGISYAEFSYVLIQAYDFYYLSKTEGVTLQLCGSDQWGNSIAGVDLTRRLTGQEVNVFSNPLIINKSTGKKFGKSEDGAIWLDEKLTSVYKFYQFWLNSDDEGVEDYLKIYSFLTQAQIEETMTQFNQDRSKRIAQKTLAYEVTKLVHGQNRAESVKRISEVLFESGSYENLVEQDFTELSRELGLIKYTGQGLVEILVEANLATSRSTARKFIESGAVYANGSRINYTETLDENLFIGNNLVLRRGKNSQVVVQK